MECVREVSKRVCLIIPPSTFLLDERVFMSLGVLKVAGTLERVGIAVEVLDLSGVSNFIEALEDHVRHSESLVFGLTATTPQLPAARMIAEKIRAICSKARLILGGPHVTLVNAARKREVKRGVVGRAHRAYDRIAQLFDVLVAGDGEEAIFQALMPKAPKLIDADDASSGLFLSSARLNELPFPARHLVDVATYHYGIEGFSALSLIAQLGCPFECGFCGGRYSPMLRRVRTRTPENIVAEMVQMWQTYGRPGFMLYDDELNVSREMLRLMELIAEAQSKLGVEWRLRGFIKAELFNEEQAEALYKAGFRWILTGFESGSPQILRAINKKATREENTRCVELAHHAGLKVKALMSIGHPGEREQTVEETLDWLIATRPDDFDCTLITTYPGTPYYDEAVPAPEQGEGVWVYVFAPTGDRLYQIAVDFDQTADYYKGDPEGGYRAYVYTEYLTSVDLVVLRDKVERTVRKELHIPFNPGAPGTRYEHSMGQSGLPSNILRSSDS